MLNVCIPWQKQSLFIAFSDAKTKLQIDWGRFQGIVMMSVASSTWVLLNEQWLLSTHQVAKGMTRINEQELAMKHWLEVSQSCLTLTLLTQQFHTQVEGDRMSSFFFQWWGKKLKMLGCVLNSERNKIMFLDFVYAFYHLDSLDVFFWSLQWDPSFFQHRCCWL